jgi:hypothetical protein
VEYPFLTDMEMQDQKDFQIIRTQPDFE